MNADPSRAGQRFAVVIVNYNGGPMLSECVRSCLGEGVPPARIVVVDNGSRDGSAENVGKQISGLRLVSNRCNAGFARAANQGIGQTDAEFVLLLNTDARLESGALAAFAAGFDERPKLAIAGGQLRYPDGRLQSAFAPLPSVAEELLPLPLLRLLAPNRFRRKILKSEHMAVESVFGACFCVRASLLPRLGLLDEDYFSFSKRLSGADAPGSRALRSGICRLRGPSTAAEQQRSVFAAQRALNISAPS